jgi:thiol-disulfide isomerase/thioredoxin
MEKFRVYICIIFCFSLFANAQDKNNIVSYTDDPFLVTEKPFFDEKLVILNFWATWCTFCVDNLKALDELQKLHKKDPLRIIALSEDFKGISTIKELFDKKKIQYLDIYLDDRNKLFKEFNIAGMPTSIIISPDGREVARITGQVNWNEEEIKVLLSKYLNYATRDKSDLIKPKLYEGKNKEADNKKQPDKKKQEVLSKSIPEGNLEYRNKK